MITLVPRLARNSEGWHIVKILMEQKTYWDDGVLFTPSERTVRRDYDVCIIGGGIIGISIAMEIGERQPNMTIAVLEKEDGPKGASTRNAGFACFGSLSEIALDVDVLGHDAAVDLVQRRVDGLQMLRSRCGDVNIRYETSGGHEIFLDHHASLDRIDEINELLHPIFKGHAFVRRDNLIAHHGFKEGAVKAFIRTEFEGMLHSGLLVSRLWDLAKQQGVKIIKCGITSLHRDNRNVDNPIELALRDGRKIVCRKVIVAANSAIDDILSIFSKDDLTALPDELQQPAFRPARGQILLTAPLSNLKLHGTYHFDQGFVYFRNVENRVLLGGGRNKALEEEETKAMNITSTIQDYLEHILYTIILPEKNFGIEYRWSGTMAFSKTKQPVVMEAFPNVIVAFGCNGMGVAIGSEVARRASRLIC